MLKTKDLIGSESCNIDDCRCFWKLAHEGPSLGSLKKPSSDPALPS